MANSIFIKRQASIMSNDRGLTDLSANWTFTIREENFSKSGSYKLIHFLLEYQFKKTMSTLSLNDSLSRKNLRWICLVASFQNKNSLPTQPKNLLSWVLDKVQSCSQDQTISINTNTDSKFVHQVCSVNNLQLKPGINLWAPLLLMTTQGQGTPEKWQHPQD